MAVLVIADRDGDTVRDTTNKTVTAALKLSSDVDVLVIGQGSKAGAADILTAAVLFSDVAFKIGATAVVGFVCVAVWRVEHAKAPRFARAAIFLFLDGALSPSTGTVLFKWYKATPDNCARGRPCFEPPLIGWLDLATQISYLVGVVAYNRWLSHLSYRAIFVGAHLLLCASAFVTLIWVGRWNLRVGVPDPAFALADNLLLPLIGRFLKIPKFVLAARACPPEAAATTFAILMMLYNFGGQVSGYAGIGLLQLLGGVEPPEFRHLERMVVSQALLKLLPIAAVWLLVPPGEGPRTPDPVLVVDADQDADAEGGGADGSFHSFVQVEQCVEERERARARERERTRERGNSFIPTHLFPFSSPCIPFLFSPVLFCVLLFSILPPRYPPLAVRRAPSWGWILENEYVWFFSSSEVCKAFFVEFNAAAP